MKKSRKLDHCLNCGESLLKEEDFCPACGQENKDQRVSIGIFLSDFFSNYLNFDSTFFRTIPVLLFKPGKLSIAFNSGRRKKFIHPIRLYLIFSLFYFFIFGFIIPKNIFDVYLNNASFSSPETIKMKLTEKEKAELDSILSKNPAAKKILNQKEKSNSLSLSDSSESINWKEIKILAQDPDVSMVEFEKTLAKASFSIGDLISPEKQRTFIANSNLFISGVARNLPLMMFLLLPVFAGILMLLYIRSDYYFVEHLIHALHLHTFAYLIYGIGILLIQFLQFNSEWVIGLAFIWVSIYTYVSFKKIYRQGWFKTFLKFFLLGHIYVFFLSIGLMIELYITLLLM
ncbi:Protein of unknown function [Belliella buryatensis]|uniref:DUF3667 domain-containing protein n=1 Tax=Belliella buryatensis TaxID=1500549 RepID=A0A239G4A3_9BACT|nr:DUF3667 domain-containing protein [Belliella buryatensis]SNS63283.1 Protein of unknown function [Belliella buryatensis]